MTSAEIAESVNTNPVVIRRLLCPLRRANLVRSRGGSGGGWQLVGNANSISLLKIWNAFECEDILALEWHRPNARCPIGHGIAKALKPVYHRASRAAKAELERVTVGSLVNSTLKSSQQKRRGPLKGAR